MLDTLAEIQERNRAVKDLEASLLELHQIFLDMAVLVEAQGEMLDNIEQQVCMRGAHSAAAAATWCQEAPWWQEVLPSPQRAPAAEACRLWQFPLPQPHHSSMACWAAIESWSSGTAERACIVISPALVVCVQVNRAADYVGGGTKALVEAKQYQKSKRKWCCCAIITLLVILIIVFVVVSCRAWLMVFVEALQPAGYVGMLWQRCASLATR